MTGKPFISERVAHDTADRRGPDGLSPIGGRYWSQTQFRFPPRRRSGSHHEIDRALSPLLRSRARMLLRARRPRTSAQARVLIQQSNTQETHVLYAMYHYHQHLQANTACHQKKEEKKQRRARRTQKNSKPRPPPSGPNDVRQKAPPRHAAAWE